jgi:hypothetical protein
LLPAESARLRPSSDTYTGHWYNKRTTTMSPGPPG